MAGKHDDSIIHPKKGRKDPDLPEMGFLCVNPGEAAKAVNIFLDNGGTNHFLHNSKLAVSEDGSRFIAGPALGAPAATLVLEKLIVLGAKKIVLMGWCGGIDPSYGIGDIVVPKLGVIGEGTSQYYTDADVSMPSAALSESLMRSLQSTFPNLKSGTLWSTDAPYRESRSYLQQLHSNFGVVGVDMEFSALCSVATFREVEFGAVMAVSDELWGESWKPGFRSKNFRQKCDLLLATLIQMRE